MQKDTIPTQNSDNLDKKAENTVKSEPWNGQLQIDPLTVRQIVEANEIVEDLEEAGEL